MEVKGECACRFCINVIVLSLFLGNIQQRFNSLRYRYNVKLFFYLFRLTNIFELVGTTRTPGTQGGYQAAGLCVALLFGIVGGSIVGM